MFCTKSHGPQLQSQNPLNNRLITLNSLTYLVNVVIDKNIVKHCVQSVQQFHNLENKKGKQDERECQSSGILASVNVHYTVCTKSILTLGKEAIIIICDIIWIRVWYLWKRQVIPHILIPHITATHASYQASDLENKGIVFKARWFVYGLI